MKTFISSFTFVVLIFISEIASAQITFQKIYGRGLYDDGRSVQQTSDGGYIMTGVTYSFSADQDAYLIKTNASGDTLWTKSFGGPNGDHGRSVEQTSDGGYIITGVTGSFGAGLGDFWLIKTDVNGDLLWTKTYGDTESNLAFSVQQTIDGGYIITGLTYGVVGNGIEIYLIKTDTNGDTLWTRTIGGPGNQIPYYVRQTADGGYIITGDIAVSTIYQDVFLIKTDATGNLLWSKTYGGAGSDLAIYVQQTADGGYIILGNTVSFGAGFQDIYLIKTNAAGDTLWTKTIGGVLDDGGSSAQQTSDGGYIIAGGTISGSLGESDVYLVKTDSIGNLLWSKIFGGPNEDGGQTVQQTTDGGYVIIGKSMSPGAVSSVYLIKTDSLGNSGCNESNITTIVTAPLTQVTTPPIVVNFTNTIVTAPAITVGSGDTVITFCTTVGIPSEVNNPKSEISISPNPFHTSTTISLNENVSPGLTFQIFNVEGKMIRQVPVISNETTIERNGLSAGVYFYQLTCGGNVKSIGKLLVQ